VSPGTVTTPATRNTPATVFTPATINTPATIVTPATVRSPSTIQSPATVVTPATINTPATVRTPSTIQTPATVVTPATITTPGTITTPATVRTPSTIQTPATVVTPATVTTPATINTPATVRTPSTIVTPGTVRTPSTINTPATVTTPATIVTPGTIRTPASVIGPSTVVTPATIVSPGTVTTPATRNTPATVFTPATINTPGTIITPATVRNPSTITSPATVVTPATIVTPGTVRTPSTIQAPGTVFTPATVSTPATIVSPGTVTTPATINSPSSITTPATRFTPSTIFTPATITTPATIVSPATIAAPNTVQVPATLQTPSTIIAPTFAPTNAPIPDVTKPPQPIRMCIPITQGECSRDQFPHFFVNYLYAASCSTPLVGTPIFQQTLRTDVTGLTNFWDAEDGIFRAEYELLSFGPVVVSVGNLSLSSNNLFVDSNNLVSGLLIGEFTVDESLKATTLPFLSAMLPPGPEFTVNFVVEGSRILDVSIGESPNTYIDNDLLLLGVQPTTPSTICLGMSLFIMANQSDEFPCDLCTECTSEVCPDLKCTTGPVQMVPPGNFESQFVALAIDGATADQIQVWPDGAMIEFEPTSFPENTPIEFMLRWNDGSITFQMGNEIVNLNYDTNTNAFRMKLVPGMTIGHKIELHNPLLNGNVLAPLTARTGEDLMLEVEGAAAGMVPSTLTGEIVFQTPAFNPSSNLVEINVGYTDLNCVSCPMLTCEDCVFDDSQAPCKGGQYRIKDFCNGARAPPTYALRLDGLDGMIINGFPTIWVFSAERGGANLTLYSEGCDAEYQDEFKIRVFGTVYGGRWMNFNEIIDEQLYQFDFTYVNAMYVPDSSGAGPGLLTALFNPDNRGYIRNINTGEVIELFQSAHDGADFTLEEPGSTGCPQWSGMGWLSHDRLTDPITGEPIHTGGQDLLFQLDDCVRQCRCIPPPNTQCYRETTTAIQSCKPLGCWEPDPTAAGCDNPLFPTN